jgi:hypothetical protein
VQAVRYSNRLDGVDLTIWMAKPCKLAPLIYVNYEQKNADLLKLFNKESRNSNIASIFLIIVLSLSGVLVLWFDNIAINASGSAIDNTNNSSNSIVLSNPRIVDPNPDLTKIDGTLENNPSLAANINTERLGTVADGVSKLLIVTESNNTLQFSIDGINDDNLSLGVLSSLDKDNKMSSTVTVNPQRINDNRSIVVAVYTPPEYIDLQPTSSHTDINILVNGTTDPRLSFALYRVPVVLVHGIWTNSDYSWVSTNFTKKLAGSNFTYFFADYAKYNSTTFDPYAIPEVGNYGINSIRNKIHNLLQDYRVNSSIAAAQVDIVAHSMGGLMARGFVQQPDYENESNYMKGFIHRLVTIGTPHFGAHLADILYDHRNDWYCFDPDTKVIIYPNGCQFDLNDFEFLQLKTLYSDRMFLSTPLDKGAVEALAPSSAAFSHLCQTNVTSYAIAGSWAPSAYGSRAAMEGLFSNILGNPLFDLDKDGFQGNFQGNNDLQVNLTSQVGGLQSEFRQSSSSDIPNQSAVYPNTIHGRIFAFGDVNAIGELGSPTIQNDVVTLLESPNNKYATAIGIGSPCSIPN